MNNEIIERKLKLKRYVTEIMLEMGIPANLKGYYYVREAVIIASEDIEVVCSMTKLLYPEVAKCFNTTSQKVERAIRNAIEVSWQRGNIKYLEELFGYTVDSGKGRPTNSEYIARIADKIKLDI